MKAKAPSPEDGYTPKRENYETSEFVELHEPSFEEPYNWDELMDGIELRRSSRNPDVGLEYLSNLGRAENYLEETEE